MAGTYTEIVQLASAGRKSKQTPVQEDNLQEQEMLEAAIEVVAEMQLTADELKVRTVGSY